MIYFLAMEAFVSIIVPCCDVEPYLRACLDSVLAQPFADWGCLLGVVPKLEMLPMQPGDVPATYASIDKLRAAVGYEPKTTIADGIPVFAQWYRAYHRLPREI